MCRAVGISLSNGPSDGLLVTDNAVTVHGHVEKIRGPVRIAVHKPATPSERCVLATQAAADEELCHHWHFSTDDHSLRGVVFVPHDAATSSADYFVVSHQHQAAFGEWHGEVRGPNGWVSLEGVPGYARVVTARG